MAKLKLKRRDLKKLGYTSGKSISVAMQLMAKHHRHMPKPEALEILSDILNDPDAYALHDTYGDIAEALMESPAYKEIPLRDQAIDYTTFGGEGIEKGAISQMETAVRLPVAVQAALMPDAHHGYGLPIGGVLATENSVIPYGVGVDIGCRMALSVYPIKASYLEENRGLLKGFLNQHSRFGQEAFDRPMDDEVLARPEFKEIPIVKSLQQRARQQIGSSGGGNHFVEFGIVNIKDVDNHLGVPEGQYLGLLTHSGSRGLGANIARHYTKLAIEKCPLPKDAKHLAWLGLDTEEGQEYWLAMNLAGDYASACHRHIHIRMAKALGEQPITKVENHHNFAWKEKQTDGRELIVHRKGATPAGKGVLGIIPGSMVAPGFIVRGKGYAPAIHSASHGAGRQMSRRKAKEKIKISDLRRLLKTHRVDLIGGGLDEAPFAYKDINEVMAAQGKLVEMLGTFEPKVVRMDK